MSRSTISPELCLAEKVWYVVALPLCCLMPEGHDGPHRDELDAGDGLTADLRWS